MVFWDALRSVLPVGRGKWSFPCTQDWWPTREVLFTVYTNSWGEGAKKKSQAHFSGPSDSTTGNTGVQKILCLGDPAWIAGLNYRGPFQHQPLHACMVLLCIPFWYFSSSTGFAPSLKSESNINFHLSTSESQL